MNRSRLFFAGLILLFFTAGLYSQTAGKSASQLRTEALKLESVQDSVEYLKSHLDSCATPSDKRSILCFTAGLQEQIGLYTEASRSYAKAAGIAASDAEGFKKVSAEQMVLNAVRTALLSGDWETADSYLNSAVRSSKSAEVKAKVNLYGVWSQLCRIQLYEDTKDSVELLKAYVSMESMAPVKREVLFTLWYITGESEYSRILLSEFPSSPEAMIINGKIQVASVPFWYFVPRAGATDSGQSEKMQPVKIETVTPAGSDNKNNGKAESSSAASSASSKNTDGSAVNKTPSDSKDKSKTAADYSRPKSSVKKQQLGLYKNLDNALELIKQVKAKGFDPYYYSETRASGTTYYIVVLDDPDGTLGKKVSAAGFDCYPVN